jgi:tetratricopeptide (TPR) repeat protein
LLQKRAWSVLLAFAALGAPAAHAEHSYYCEAVGVYALCRTENNFERCHDQSKTGVGLASKQSDAQLEALSMCTNSMLSAVIIGNYPTGSSYISQRSFIRSNCQATGCREVAGAMPTERVEPEPTYATETDRHLAKGDAMFRAGNAEGAVENWERAISTAPERADGYLRILYLLSLKGEYERGCQAIDRGLEAAPASLHLILGKAECGIYRKQPQSTIELGRRLLTASDEDIRLGAALALWLGQSLQGGSMAECGRLVQALQSRAQPPVWDLNPLENFLVAQGTDVADRLLDALLALETSGTDGLKQHCGR